MDVYIYHIAREDSRRDLEGETEGSSFSQGETEKRRPNLPFNLCSYVHRAIGIEILSCRGLNGSCLMMQLQ